MSDMIIYHDNHYCAWISENCEAIADAGFYSEDTLNEANSLNVNNSDLFLCVGLDYEKQPNRHIGSYDFQEEYARKVAQMVYEMMLKQ